MLFAHCSISLIFLVLVEASMRPACNPALLQNKTLNTEKESWRTIINSCLTEYGLVEDLEAVKFVLALPHVLPEDIIGLDVNDFSKNILKEIERFRGLKSKFLGYCSAIYPKKINKCLAHPYFKVEYFQAGVLFSMAKDKTASIWSLVDSKHLKTLEKKTLESLFLYVCTEGYDWCVNKILRETVVDPTVNNHAALKAAVQSDSTGAVKVLLQDWRVRPELYVEELYSLATKLTTISLIVDSRLVPSTQILLSSLAAGNTKAYKILVGHPNVDPDALELLRSEHFLPDVKSTDEWTQLMSGRIQEARQGDYSSFGPLKELPSDAAETVFFTACMNGHGAAVKELLGQDPMFLPRHIQCSGQNLAIRFDYGDIALMIFQDFSLRISEDTMLRELEQSVALAYSSKSKSSLKAYCNYIFSGEKMRELLATASLGWYPMIRQLALEYLVR